MMNSQEAEFINGLKSHIANLEAQNKELTDKYAILVQDYSSKFYEQAKEIKELMEALEEISEVTVICGNFQEAFNIVQNLVSHTINGTER